MSPILTLNKKGIKAFDKASQDSEIRCSECWKLFAKGRYPLDPIEIKCPRCKKLNTFRRLN